MIIIFFCQINWCRCRTKTDGCKFACIAMGQNTIAGLQQFHAIFTDLVTYGNVLVANDHCLLMQCVNDGRNILICMGCHHTFHTL